MAKRAASSGQDHPLAPQVDELAARVGHVESLLNGIDARLQHVHQLLGELEATKRLSLEAVAQAQDAQETSSGLDARINHLTLAVAEGIQHVDRAERRIAATVKRARALLRESEIESPGLEAEAHELRLYHGGGGEEERVPPVPEAVADPQTDPLLERLRVIGLSR